MRETQQKFPTNLPTFNPCFKTRGRLCRSAEVGKPTNRPQASSSPVAEVERLRISVVESGRHHLFQRVEMSRKRSRSVHLYTMNASLTCIYQERLKKKNAHNLERVVHSQPSDGRQTDGKVVAGSSHVLGTSLRLEQDESFSLT